MKTPVVVIANRHYIEELHQHYQSERFVLHFEDVDRLFRRGLPQSLDALEARFKNGAVQGFVGLTDLAAFVASLLNERCGLPGPTPRELFNCQNKFLVRQALFAALPHATPRFALAEQALKSPASVHLPCFAKPVRGSLSLLAHKIEDWSELPPLMHAAAQELPKANAAYLEACQLAGIKPELADQCIKLICEEFIPNGTQVTIDGYSYQGDSTFFGITKSVFMPNHISFKRFDHPYQAGRALQDHLYRVARKAIRALKLDNTLFNIECKVDEEAGDCKIVEINVRPSSQFMYPIQVVTGVNPLDVALQLAIGEQPDHQPAAVKHQACSVVVLRREQDGLVQNVPNETVVARARKQFPGLRFTSYFRPGEQLGSQLQDPYTFRFGEVVVPHAADADVADFDKQLRKQFSYTFIDTLNT